MNVYTTDSIRNVVLLGHGGSGKTSLVEAMAYVSGLTSRIGKVTDGTTISDYDKEEIKRKFSINTSVVPIIWKDTKINILDTPGHQDFSEDTYRTLMAADSAVMVIDASKGVEAQTRKLFKVCVMRHIPIFTFINKMDRDANDTFELLDDIEKELGIATCPVNWPIGSGKNFKGVYERESQCVITYADTEKGTKEGHATRIPFFGDGESERADWGRFPVTAYWRKSNFWTERAHPST